MKKIIALVMFSLLSSAAYAASPNVSYSMPAVELGFKWNSGSYDSTLNPGVSDKQEIGFQVGASTVFDFAPSFGLKTGLFYSERPFTAEASGVTAKSKATYFEVPAFFMFKFEDYAGVYVGPSLAVNLGHDNLTETKSLVVPITFGAQFKFLPNMGANIFFETVPSEIAKGIKSSRAVGVNLLLTFD